LSAGLGSGPIGGRRPAPIDLNQSMASAARDLSALKEEDENGEPLPSPLPRVSLLPSTQFAHESSGYGSFFPAESYTRGCHWIPRMFA
jgi:hypothetical protein